MTDYTEKALKINIFTIRAVAACSLAFGRYSEAPDDNGMQMSGQSAYNLLLSLTEGAPEEKLTIHDINDAMGERAFGIVLLLFTLPNCFPLPGIPGVSFVTGLPVVLFSLQMLWGARHPWLPAWIQKYSITRGGLARILKKAEPYWRYIEKTIRPRWAILVNSHSERWMGALALVLSILLSLPIPAGNLLPAVALALLSLGMLQRDGGTVALGYGLGIISIAWIITLFYTGEKLWMWLKHVFF